MNLKQVKQIGAVIGIGAVLMLVMACALEGEAATVQPGSVDSVTTDPPAPCALWRLRRPEGDFYQRASGDLGQRTGQGDDRAGAGGARPERGGDHGDRSKRPRRSGACDGGGHDSAEVERRRGERHPDAEFRHPSEVRVAGGGRKRHSLQQGRAGGLPGLQPTDREGARFGRGQHSHRRGDHRRRRRDQVQRPYVYGRGHLAAAGPTAGRCRERCEDQGTAFRRSLRDDSWKADLHGGAGRRTTVWGSIRRVPGICTGGQRRRRLAPESAAASCRCR